MSNTQFPRLTTKQVRQMVVAGIMQRLEDTDMVELFQGAEGDVYCAEVDGTIYLISFDGGTFIRAEAHDGEQVACCTGVVDGLWEIL